MSKVLGQPARHSFGIISAGNGQGVERDFGEDQGMIAAVKLADVAELVMGQSPPSTSYNDIGDGLPFYQGKTDFGATYPTPRIYCREPKKLAKSGDILMSVRAPVGATNICDSQSCIGRGIAAIRAKNIDRDFLYFYLKEIETYIDSLGSGAIFKAINKSQLAELPINKAGIPLPEQKKIAHILSTVQRAIDAQDRIIQTTTELKKALMHKLFTEGLDNEPQKQTEIGAVPESWDVVEIGDLGKCVTGSTPKTKVASFYDPPSEDFIAPADIGTRRYVYDSEKKISPAGMATIRPLPKNAVMCVCIGSSIGKVGMSYREESATNQQINSIICREGRDPEFVYFLLSYRSEYWRSFATFGPVPILSKGRFSKIVVPIPSSLDEQQAIAKPLVALETKVEVAEKKVTVLKDLFRTLLHELMTAKTRVHEMEIHA